MWNLEYIIPISRTAVLWCLLLFINIVNVWAQEQDTAAVVETDTAVVVEQDSLLTEQGQDTVLLTKS